MCPWQPTTVLPGTPGECLCSPTLFQYLSKNDWIVIRIYCSHVTESMYFRGIPLTLSKQLPLHVCNQTATQETRGVSTCIGQNSWSFMMPYGGQWKTYLSFAELYHRGFCRDQLVSCSKRSSSACVKKHDIPWLAFSAVIAEITTNQELSSLQKVTLLFVLNTPSNNACHFLPKDAHFYSTNVIMRLKVVYFHSQWGACLKVTTYAWFRQPDSSSPEGLRV